MKESKDIAKLEDDAMNKEKKDWWDKAKILSQILAIIALIVFGYIINSSLKNKEINLQLVKVAVDVLRAEPNENNMVLREWAVEVVDSYSGIRECKSILEQATAKQGGRLRLKWSLLG